MSSTGCFRAFGGWLAGCGAATAVIFVLPSIFMFAVSGRPWTDFARGFVLLLNPSLLLFVVICVMTAFPAIVMIRLSVVLGTRSVVFFACAGAALGALSISLLARSAEIWTSGIGGLFAVAGLAAGVAYWFVAGKYTEADGHVPSDTVNAYRADGDSGNFSA